jgi:diadenosine tetraphosphate (Ap4A) HIT family hydrolase
VRPPWCTRTKKHADNIFALDDAQTAAVFRSAARVSRRMGKPPARRCFTWPVKNPAREKLVQYAEKIRARL